jgi:hypothetical protein
LILYFAVDVKKLYRIGLPMGETHSMPFMRRANMGSRFFAPVLGLLGSKGAESAIKSVKGRI